MCTPATENTSCAETPLRHGLVTIFTGDGRGKTTAAIGTALRAAGHGLRVLIVFFMKGPNFTHGEVVALKTVPNITIKCFGALGWAKPGADNATHKLQAAEALSFVASQMASGGYDLAVLDEALNAVTYGLLSPDALIQIITAKPANLELILTGRGATSEFIEHADLVTEMRNIKHPFEHGIMARAGVDY